MSEILYRFISTPVGYDKEMLCEAIYEVNGEICRIVPNTLRIIEEYKPMTINT